MVGADPGATAEAIDATRAAWAAVYAAWAGAGANLVVAAFAAFYPLIDGFRRGRRTRTSAVHSKLEIAEFNVGVLSHLNGTLAWLYQYREVITRSEFGVSLEARLQGLRVRHAVVDVHLERGIDDLELEIISVETRILLADAIRALEAIVHLQHEGAGGQDGLSAGYVDRLDAAIRSLIVGSDRCSARTRHLQELIEDLRGVL